MNIIFLIHLFFLICVLVIPFSNDRKKLEFYSILIPFIFYHWSINDDTMCHSPRLKYILGHGKEKEETFIYMDKLVSVQSNL